MTPPRRVDGSVDLRGVQKELRPAVRAALEQGWTLTKGRTHPKLRSPSGALVVFPGTPRGGVSVVKLTADLRRHGVRLD